MQRSLVRQLCSGSTSVTGASSSVRQGTPAIRRRQAVERPHAQRAGSTTPPIASPSVEQWASVSPQTIPEPCGVDGGRYPAILHQLLRQKQKSAEHTLRSALYELWCLAEPNEKVSRCHHGNEIETECTARIAKLLKTIFVTSARHSNLSSSSLCVQYHVDLPDGRVVVAKEVALAYDELLHHGLDAHGWWERYYCTYIQNHPDKDGTTGKDGSSRSVSEEQEKGAAAAPLFCWRLQESKSTRKKDGQVSLRFATLTPRGAPPASPTDLTHTPLSVLAREPCWIPLSLLLHLPFFPLPHPWKATGTAGRNSSSFSTDTLDNLIEGDEGEPDGAGQAEAATCEADSSDSTGSQAAALATDSPELPLLTRERWAGGATCGSYASHQLDSYYAALHRDEKAAAVGYMHDFYDSLFPQDTALAALQASGSTSINSEAASMAASMGDLAAQKRAMCPSTAPWRRIPFWTNLDGNEEDAATASAAVPKGGGQRGAGSVPASARWPSPPAALQLPYWHLGGLSSFWAGKRDVQQRLPYAYFFPPSAFPFLFGQRRRADAAEGQRHYRHKYKDSRAARSQFNAQPSWDKRRSAATAGQDTKKNRWPPANVCSPFANLGKSINHERVTFFGTRYINVARTTLACMFDSAVCVTHAIPLTVYGSVQWRFLTPIRHRQQYAASEEDAGTPRAPPPLLLPNAPQMPPQQISDSPAEASSDRTQKDKRDGEDGCVSAAALPAAAAAAATTGAPESPWLRKLRIVKAQVALSSAPQRLSFTDATMQMRRLQLRNSFRFRSPYWVSVTDLYERWGVHVAPGVAPLAVANDFLVNAEQTTNASHFTPATCVPHLGQSILFSDRLLNCSWQLSEDLRHFLLGETRPRRSGGSVVGAWTYATLQRRAEAAQSVANMWVADEVVDDMGWTVAAVPLPDKATQHNTNLNQADTAATSPLATRHGIPRVTIQVRRLPALQLRERLIAAATAASGAAAHDATADTAAARHYFLPPSDSSAAATQSLQRSAAEASVTVVHVSAIREQSELLFVASYSPLVMVACVAAVTREELQAERWSQPTSRHRTKLYTQRRLSASSRLEDDDATSGTGSEEADETDARLMGRALAKKRKPYLAFWSGAKLTRASSLKLAKLALQKRYRPENADKWVTVDFLRQERRVQPARRVPVADAGSGPASATTETAASCSLTAIDVEVLLQKSPVQGSDAEKEGDAAAEMLLAHVEEAGVENGEYDRAGVTVARLTLINREELQWPPECDGFKSKYWILKRL